MKSMDEVNRRYMGVRNGKHEAVVKFDDEGVVIDLWYEDSVIASTYRLYDELPVTLKEGE